MKCREAQYWLYSFRPNSSWPVDVVGHLQTCAKCQLLQTKLKQIDQGVDKFTSAPGSPAAVSQLLERVKKTQQVAAPSQTVSGQPWRWIRAGAWLSGAAALILLGWIVGRQTGNVEVSGDPVRTVTVFQDKVVEKIVEVNSPLERILFSKLLKHNARLVQALQSSDRLEALLDMADDCRQHALALIEQGPRESLPLAIDLHGQVLREGVAVQVALAPAEARRALQQTAHARLKKMADGIAAPKTLPGALAEQHEILQAAISDTIELVDEPKLVLQMEKLKQKPSLEALSPTATLVRFAVTVSSETDPVVKADLCTHYVKRLMPTMNLYLSEDSVPQRGEMGQQFGEMIQFGVYRPLELASKKEPAPPIEVAAETKRIFDFAAETIASMQNSLKQAPEDARQGFEKAIEPSKTVREKNKEKSKGKNGKGPRDIRGTLQKIDRASSTITVSTKNAEFTYTLTRELLSAIQGKSRPSLNLQAGAGVQLRLSEDRRTVIEIRSGKDANDDGDKNQK